MHRRIYGTSGLTLGILAVITGTYAILMYSFSLGFGYLFLAAVCGILITWIFCSKCPIKGACVHILPGYIARVWKEKSGPYTSVEILVTGLLLAIIILPPQIYLISSSGLFALFWVFIGIAAVCSTWFLCPDCGNILCPFQRRT
ncbi:MAG TPA: hypothetical protein VN372_03360 [Methanospirillum sp.]|nr:hypothetical protein [Methanospirillum sp.]